MSWEWAYHSGLCYLRGKVLGHYFCMVLGIWWIASCRHAGVRCVADAETMFDSFQIYIFRI